MTDLSRIAPNGDEEAPTTHHIDQPQQTLNHAARTKKNNGETTKGNAGGGCASPRVLNIT